MILLFGDALARVRMAASSVYGYVYVRRIPDDYNASANYLTDQVTTQQEPSSTVLEGHHLPLDHNFFQDNQSDVDFEISDDSPSLPLSVFLPLGVMLLFAALILLVVLFRRHPAAVMAVAAAALLAAGAYNLLILFQSSGDVNGYHGVFNLKTSPKYE